MKIFYGLFGKINAVILTTTILVSILVYPAFAEEAPYIPQEITEKRTEYSKTYLNEDGSYTAKASLSPIHYKKNKAWEEIDNTIIPSTAGYSYENKGNSYKVKFKKSVDELYPISFENKGYKINIDIPQKNKNILSGIQNETVVSQNKISYKDKNNKLTIKHTVLPEKVKEDIILYEKPANDQFIYEIKAANLEISKNEDNSVVFSNSSGKEVARINPMIMFEGLTPPVDDEKQVKALDLKLTKNGDSTILTYTDSDNWLAEKDRNYPVTIDPTIVIVPDDSNGNGVDTMIRDYSGTSYQYKNYGNSSGLSLRDQPNEISPLIKFADPINLGIPNDARIMSASLDLYQYYTSAYANVAVNRVIHRWKEGTGSGVTNSASVDGATGLERFYGNNANDGNNPFNDSDADWAATGGDYYTASNETTKAQSGINTWWSFDISKIFRQWASGDVENHGIIIRALSNEVQTSYYSKDYSTDTTLRPKLTITYTEANRIGIGTSWTYQGVDIGANANASVNDVNGNLVVSKSLINVPGRGMPVSINPTYNSLETSSYDKGFGSKWSYNFAPTISGSDPVIYKDTTGLEHAFYKNSDGNYFHPAGFLWHFNYSKRKHLYLQEA